MRRMISFCFCLISVISRSAYGRDVNAVCMLEMGVALANLRVFDRGREHKPIEAHDLCRVYRHVGSACLYLSSVCATVLDVESLGRWTGMAKLRHDQGRDEAAIEHQQDSMSIAYCVLVQVERMDGMIKMHKSILFWHCCHSKSMVAKRQNPHTDRAGSTNEAPAIWVQGCKDAYPDFFLRVYNCCNTP